jgi:hypothetical protein
MGTRRFSSVGFVYARNLSDASIGLSVAVASVAAASVVGTILGARWAGRLVFTRPSAARFRNTAGFESDDSEEGLAQRETYDMINNLCGWFKYVPTPASIFYFGPFSANEQIAWLIAPLTIKNIEYAFLFF